MTSGEKEFAEWCRLRDEAQEVRQSWTSGDKFAWKLSLVAAHEQHKCPLCDGDGWVYVSAERFGPLQHYVSDASDALERGLVEFQPPLPHYRLTRLGRARVTEMQLVWEYRAAGFGPALGGG